MGSAEAGHCGTAKGHTFSGDKKATTKKTVDKKIGAAAVGDLQRPIFVVTFLTLVTTDTVSGLNPLGISLPHPY
jgi:hypothetical protein